MILNTHDLFNNDKNDTIQQFINNVPLFIGAKNITSQFLMGNNFYTNLVGLPNNQALKGLYDEEINCRIKQIAPSLMVEDALVMKQKHSCTILSYGFYANNRPLLGYGKKYPIIDEKETVLGCGFCCQDITNSRLINLIPLLSLRQTVYGSRQLGNQFSYIIAESIPEYDLSNRQIECLFHLLRGQSANDIAITLHISKRTVETHIDIIKYKLGCDTKAQLIDKAINTGLLNYIPRSLMEI